MDSHVTGMQTYAVRSLFSTHKPLRKRLLIYISFLSQWDLNLQSRSKAHIEVQSLRLHTKRADLKLLFFKYKIFIDKARAGLNRLRPKFV